MTRNLLAFPFQPYAGIYSSAPFNDGRGKPKGLAVIITIPWGAYRIGNQPPGTLNPNFSVDVNLNSAGPNSVSQLWNIQSVYVDNEAVEFPVYVSFPDTHFTISVPPNSSGWYQVVTNGRHAIVSAIGITDATHDATTTLYFTDAVVFPSSDFERETFTPLYIASPLINRGSAIAQSSFGAPSLGDQYITAVINPLVGAASVAIPFPISTGFIIIKSMIANFASGGSPNPVTFVNVKLRNTDTVHFAGGLWDFNWFDAASLGVYNVLFPALNGVNLKLDATQNYELDYNVAGTVPGNFQVQFIFTTQP